MVYALIQPRPQLRSNTFPPPQKFPSKLFTATAKSLQLCPTLCNPIDGSPPGSPVSGILQAITLEWVAISFSNAWKWKVKVKSLSCVRPSATPWTAAFQAPPSMGFSRQEYWSGVPLPSPNSLAFIKFHNQTHSYFCTDICIFTWDVPIRDQTRSVAQSCPTLCDPMNCSPPHSSVHGIFQAVILEWVAISFSRNLRYLVFFNSQKYFWCSD